MLPICVFAVGAAGPGYVVVNRVEGELQILLGHHVLTHLDLRALMGVRRREGDPVVHEDRAREVREAIGAQADEDQGEPAKLRLDPEDRGDSCVRAAALPEVVEGRARG